MKGSYLSEITKGLYNETKYSGRVIDFDILDCKGLVEFDLKHELVLQSPKITRPINKKSIIKMKNFLRNFTWTTKKYRF